jgi:glyoxylase-like metal-dependent hydrolase (beta-lactamase superfamily II)
MKAIILSLLSFLFIQVASAQRFDNVEITVEKINENLYVLFGAGGNIAVLTGSEGTVMIDNQFAPLSDKILSAIGELTSQPIQYVINTHWHGDHTGGNANFAKQGATIIAHENVRKRLMTDNVRPFGRTSEAQPEAAWPRLTFDKNMQVHHNGVSIQLLHYHAGHTDGDALVMFGDYNVLHMGDIFFKDRFPFIDTALGGDPDGLIAIVEAALMLSDANTTIIPGHGAISNKEDLRRYHQMLLIVKGRVMKAITAGTPLEDVDVATIVKDYETWGEGFIKPEVFVKTLYKAYSDEGE